VLSQSFPCHLDLNWIKHALQGVWNLFASSKGKFERLCCAIAPFHLFYDFSVKWPNLVFEEVFFRLLIPHFNCHDKSPNFLPIFFFVCVSDDYFVFFLSFSVDLTDCLRSPWYADWRQTLKGVAMSTLSSQFSFSQCPQTFYPLFSKLIKAECITLLIFKYQKKKK